jgi:hypothetical protein
MNPNLLTLANGVANALIAAGGIAFVVFVFGRSESSIYRTPWVAHLLKAGLSLVSVGAMLNIVTFSTPPISEIVLNVGLGMTFAVAAIWHFITFVKQSTPPKTNEPRTNKRTRSVRRPANQRGSTHVGTH